MYEKLQGNHKESPSFCGAIDMEASFYIAGLISSENGMSRPKPPGRRLPWRQLPAPAEQGICDLPCAINSVAVVFGRNKFYFLPSCYGITWAMQDN